MTIKKYIFICILLIVPLAADAQYTGGHEDGYDMISFSATVTGIAEQDAPFISVYPSPVSQGEEIVIAGKFTAAEVKVSITDLTGREVFIQTSRAHGGRITILPAKLAPGVYMLRVHDKYTSCKKIFVN